ncbi:MAG: hypothetical protein HOC92_02640 [Gammaproteobacteria bacterium]|nr:hypothetical protein [Gammaproteobacteria bacterium]
MEPIPYKIRESHPRYDEIYLYVSEVDSNIASLDHAGLIHKKIIQNYRSIPASDSFLSGYVKKTTRATKSRLIETVQMYDLIDFAKNNNFEEAYIGLSGNTKEKPMQGSERKALYKMILGMALSKYDLDPLKCTVGKDDSRGSIPCELKELGLSVDRTTVVKHLKAALEEWGDTEDINRLDKFKKK